MEKKDGESTYLHPKVKDKAWDNINNDIQH